MIYFILLFWHIYNFTPRKIENSNSCSVHVIYCTTSYPHGSWSLSKAQWTSWPSVPRQRDKKQQSFPHRQARVASWLVVSTLRDKDLSKLGRFRGAKWEGDENKGSIPVTHTHVTSEYLCFCRTSSPGWRCYCQTMSEPLWWTGSSCAIWPITLVPALSPAYMYHPPQWWATPLGLYGRKEKEK